MQGKRLDRVNRLVREEISHLLQRELKDPGLGFVTVTEVDVAKDLRTAKVYVSILGVGEPVAGFALEALSALEASSVTGWLLDSRCAPSLTSRFTPTGRWRTRRTSRRCSRDSALRRPRRRRRRRTTERVDDGRSPDVVELILPVQRVALLAHLFPDGDVLGSQLGLGLALRAAGREVTFACLHTVPEPFHFLPGAREVQQWKEGLPGFDLVVTLDTPDPARVGGLVEGCRQAGARVLNIDHHPDSCRYGDVNWVRREAAATGEMVYDLILAAKLPLGPDVATNLYTAIVTDTGSFRYSNTTPQTFRTAARLVELAPTPGAWRPRSTRRGTCRGSGSSASSWSRSRPATTAPSRG